ncbi:hypothetical protein GR183_13035 [Stappia sp. GBMRC 2046]|uniref:Thaumarchaeal output domain-containing protein n=1 Tax=Stappia sediminis TaxID=2692190 RepID=A0A7X3LVE8_9HYPH|nr:hypothetical protein [Stappia sediminis]MXN65832.1 hypothetical protein [Stappia sediminis]
MSKSEAVNAYAIYETQDAVQGAVTAANSARPKDSSAHAKILDDAKILCFAPERLAASLPTFGRLRFVTDRASHFDLIIAETEDDIGDFETFVAQSGNPAAPLIAFSQDFGERADFVLKDPSPNALVSAITSLLPIYARLVELPAIPRGVDRNGLLALSLAYTRERKIGAEWRPEHAEAIGYPLLRGMDNPRPVLERLADAGLLERQFCQRLHLCRHCNSSRIFAREVCISCRSSNLTESALVHHYACGTQASQTDFEQREGYVCPKCNKKLRHYGVDYDKPGAVFSCGCCGASMAEPDVGFTCSGCGGYTCGEESETRDWYHYSLLPDGLAALRAGKLPRTGFDDGQSGRLSLRDFKLITQSRLRDMRRHGRPMSVLKLDFDTADLEERIGRRGMLNVCAFALEIAVQDFHESDVTTSLPRGLAVCLADTDAAGAADVGEGIMAKLRAAVGVTMNIDTKVFEGEQIDGLLKELCGC